MTCLDVRSLLTEQALGLLSPVDARGVERHLEWCAGCRKEAEELKEGAAMMVLALPAAEPPGWLRSRIMDRIASAAGTGRAPSRSRIRLLVAATLAAVVVAVGATGWAISERGEVQSIREATAEQLRRAEVLEKLLESLKANPLVAGLLPVLDGQGSGRALIYSDPDEPDFIHVSVSLMGPQEGEYTIQMKDRDGRVLSAGRLIRMPNGILIFYEVSGRNLSRGTSITVLDDTGRPVMKGRVQPAAED